MTDLERSNAELRAALRVAQADPQTHFGRRDDPVLSLLRRVWRETKPPGSTGTPRSLPKSADYGFPFRPPPPGFYLHMRKSPLPQTPCVSSGLRRGYVRIRRNHGATIPLSLDGIMCPPSIRWNSTSGRAVSIALRSVPLRSAGPWPLTLEISGRHSPQLGVDHRNEPVGRLLVAGAKLSQQGSIAKMGSDLRRRELGAVRLEVRRRSEEFGDEGGCATHRKEHGRTGQPALRQTEAYLFGDIELKRPHTLS
jgi:hypothetical protein